jgi:hypothetical protein
MNLYIPARFYFVIKPNFAHFGSTGSVALHVPILGIDRKGWNACSLLASRQGVGETRNNKASRYRPTAFFQICASDTGLSDDELVEPPAASEKLIPGVLNSPLHKSTRSEGNLMCSIILTCVGEEEPRLIGIPVWYEALSEDIMAERAPFRINALIYLHRLTRLYNQGYSLERERKSR